MYKTPTLGKDVKIAKGAVVIGDVTIGDESSVWFNAVVRSEESTITIGHHTNVQDNCTLHVDLDNHLNIGNYVTIGHGAIVHGCTVGNNTLIGMGAIILNNAVIGDNCIIGAGALITENTTIPDGSLVIGCPGKVARKLTDEDKAKLLNNANHYVEFAKKYL